MLMECKDCNNRFDRADSWPYRSCTACKSTNTELIGPLYVNVYLVDQAYGGPEEGGWYYKCGEPMESCHVETEVEANEVAEKLRAKWSNEGRRPISSVLSQGVYEVSVEDCFAQPFPDRRPHYE